MFDYDLTHWLSFAGTVTIILLTPGPDMANIVMRSLSSGVRGGLTSLGGMCAGALIQILLVCMGLGAVIAASPMALTLIKWGGALYLVVLGVRLLTSRANGDNEHPATTAEQGSIFRGALLINLLNPKAIIFYLAFLPQFVVPGQAEIWMQLLLHGLAVIAMIVALYAPIACTISYLKPKRHVPRHGRLLDRAMGAAFVGLGLRLAWAN